MTTFAQRHIGISDCDAKKICSFLGVDSAAELLASTVPESIRVIGDKSDLPEALQEHEALDRLRGYVQDHQSWRNFIGMGYYTTITPPAILRYLFENPGWYTPYTPYQAEISQGRLELLFHFQTITCELTGMDLAGASLLDEGTAVAEAFNLSLAVYKGESCGLYFASSDMHPQTLAVLRSRAEARGVELWVDDVSRYMESDREVFGGVVQYPSSCGYLEDYTKFVQKLHKSGALAACATDLLALTLLAPPGEMGFDIACGSTQRLGVPMGFGGPHAAFFATSMNYKRQMPGRVVGRSKDRHGRAAYRLALQTREQHIRRERATSNICTAQALLACMAAAYVIYHGREELRSIAMRMHRRTRMLSCLLQQAGFVLADKMFFDTLCVHTPSLLQREQVLARLSEKRINVRCDNPSYLIVSLGETASDQDVVDICSAFVGKDYVLEDLLSMSLPMDSDVAESLWKRPLNYLSQEIFSHAKSELVMLRYLKHLENRDLSLVHSMIPLGSCTMKLNAASELQPLSWPEFADVHPHQAENQLPGFVRLLEELSSFLCALTGLAAVSLQPNSGAQGELAGLMTISRYHRSRKQERSLCLVPASAHGTNPASAVMAGLKVKVVSCDSQGNIHLDDLSQILEDYGHDVSCIMITYPSTHGVYELHIATICDMVHAVGGQVYLDGANLNAQLEVCKPGEYGIDVCHMNLHKTFCIPHGGGGPGAGPIAVASHLVEFLPSHPLLVQKDSQKYSVSSCYYGSPLILPISWMYIMMMGAAGLRRATEVAVLSANYIARRLSDHYPLLYTGAGGWVAHECLLDLRAMTKATGVTVEDVAKRLMDYGFHAPTMSFPLPGTLMIEPTESESLAELDRFIQAMISIREEIHDVETGKYSRDNHPLKNAPHVLKDIISAEWSYPYSRELACFPMGDNVDYKFWPACSRIDNAHGDRQLICACPPVSEYSE